MTPPARRAWLPGLRMQLTLFAVILFMALVLIGGAIFYQAVQASLAAGFDTELRIHTEQIAGGVSLNAQGQIQVQDATGELLDLNPIATMVPATPTATPAANQPTPDPSLGAPTNIQAAVSFGTLVRVLDPKGKVVYISPAFRALKVPQMSISQAAAGTAWRGTVAAHNGQSVRVYSEPQFDGNGNVFAIVQVGESLAPLATTLHSVLGLLFVILPIILVLDALGSFWLAGRALRPIARLTRAARQIQAGDLRQRVPVPGTHDEVRRLAQTFNEMIAHLDEAFTQQQRFVADASHELRTPVAAIRSMAEVALKQTLTPEATTQTLQGIVIEAERLSQLISELLMLARVDEGQTQLTREPVRLDLLVADVVMTRQIQAHERNVSLHATFAPVTVMGDEARLIQVVINLVDNALRYTDQGGTVEVVTGANAENAYLSVHDSGIGIAAGDQAHVFERFYRTDGARGRSRGGTGLGLALVAWVVRAHGGSITLTSLPGVGSTFAVTLPLRGPDPPPEEVAAQIT